MPTRPRVYRPIEGRLHLSMPWGADNRQWLKDSAGASIRPQWNREDVRWEIARIHLRTLITALADRFGEVDVVLEFRDTEQCDKRCRDATGDDCVCSCLGENHGGSAYWKYWMEVGETTLIAPGVLRQTRRVVTAAPRASTR